MGRSDSCSRGPVAFGFQGVEHWRPLFAGIWGFMVFFWLAVDLKNKTKQNKTKQNRVTFPKFCCGSGWVALLSCGHGDGASFILGFRRVLGWWGSGVWSRSSGDLRLVSGVKKKF